MGDLMKDNDRLDAMAEAISLLSKMALQGSMGDPLALKLEAIGKRLMRDLEERAAL